MVGPVKFKTPFRIFRKERAPEIKRERPNLTARERQAAIKEEWRCLDGETKYKYVIFSRIDQVDKRLKREKEFLEGRYIARYMEDCLGLGVVRDPDEDPWMGVPFCNWTTEGTDTGEPLSFSDNT